MVGFRKRSKDMTDFFRELEEEIREERVVILWRKYGNLVITLAVFIVIGTAGYSIWNYMKHQGKIERHGSFAKAINLMNQGKKEEALASFQALSKEGGGYGKLAQLYEAALLPDPGALYNQIVMENPTDPALGNLAKILKASHELASVEEMASIQPLSAPRNAWAPLTLELLAYADLKKGDEVKAAEQYIKLLKEPTITADEKIRASMMLSQIDVPSFLLEEQTKQGEQ